MTDPDVRMTGDLARTGATMVAVGRLGAGLVALVWPEFAARCWLGDRGRGRAARVLGRGLGGRDLALAVGALAALRDGGPADRRRWLALGCLADSGDALATLLAWSSLPPVRRAIVLAASVGAAAVGLAAAREAQLSRR